MINCRRTLVKIAPVGMALTASGCGLGMNELIDDYPPGLATVFGIAGFDCDEGHPGNGGGMVGDNSNASGGGNQAAGGVQMADNGPGNSGFGRGAHANAGGGNGTEMDGNGNELDAGNSGRSKGCSMTKD